MGTKNNPGEFDCYQKAEDDEPLFTLLGRDPQGADFVRLWAMLRAQDYSGARRVFESMLVRCSRQAHRSNDPAKIVEANHVAADMWEFFEKRKGPRI